LSTKKCRHCEKIFLDLSGEMEKGRTEAG